jgi:hypothetical protein
VTAHRWSRRSTLALGVGILGLTLAPRPAQGVPVTVNGLAFTAPQSVQPVAPDAALGRGWQWQGQQRGTGSAPATVVLARADLASTDAEEVLGLLLASAATGVLPELALSGDRTRDMPGGGQQSRVNLRYLYSPGTARLPGPALHGTLLIAVRDRAPAGVLAVLGDDTLAASTIEAVLESARWLT